jgi:3-deoxy-D-manno-octulosonate 8-phosphate phosphatase (KDO 8-P phosphatase)
MGIKLVILDIDGVMTDGTKLYGLDGIPFAKSYCDKDFTAIKKLKAAGIKVCFLSGDEKVNLAMSVNRNIDFYSARGSDKKDFISFFEKEYQVKRSNMAYIGDDLFDLNIMKNIGYPYCPSDSCSELLDLCNNKVIPVKGGQNVVMKFVEIIIDEGLMVNPTLAEVEEFDKLEVF